MKLTWRLYRERYLFGGDREALGAMLLDAGFVLRGAGRGTGAARITAPGPTGSGAGPPDPGTLDELVVLKRRAYRRWCGGVLRVSPSIARLVRALARETPLAVVSSATGEEVRAVLRVSRLAGCFRTVVAAEDVHRTKPHPDGYRVALRRLRTISPVRARRCLVIEDSHGGIAAARAAGLPILGVTSSYTAAALRRSGALATVASLEGLTPEDLLGRKP